jgi:23S rRNA (adenine2030-N6)-methyltransferase
MHWPDAPGALLPLIEAVRAQNPNGGARFYPGSPLLVRAALREQDRLVACELHGDDAATLKARFRNDPQTQIHARDGWEALPALLPLKERRGLVLIDPPYEEEGELARAARAIGAAAPRFPGGVFLWWRPLKDVRDVDAADAELRFHLRALPTAPETLRADLAVARATPDGKLAASSLLLVNPPYGLANTLKALLPVLANRLAQGEGAAWRLA